MCGLRMGFAMTVSDCRHVAYSISHGLFLAWLDRLCIVVVQGYVKPCMCAMVYIMDGMW